MQWLSYLYHYCAVLPRGKIILWCYLIWYLVIVSQHFDPTPTIWLNSLGIAVVIGFALLLSVSSAAVKPDVWQKVRLFLMPFCVSSFSSLIKGKGFILIFPPILNELLIAIGTCLLFVGLVSIIKMVAHKQMKQRLLS